MALQSHFERWLDNAYPTRSIDLASTKEVIHILTARKDEKWICYVYKILIVTFIDNN